VSGQVLSWLEKAPVPHLDVFETGRRGAAVLQRLLRGARPVRAFQKLPLVVPPQNADTQDPASVSYELRRQLQELEGDARILAAGLATVQPWLDIPELGSAVVIVADQDAELAGSSCSRIAADVWQQRCAYLPQMLPAAQAVREAHEVGAGLVVLSDGADATTSGAPGDSTNLLRELLKYDWPRPVLVTLVAPEVVAEAQQRGLGATWATALGGIRDSQFSRPLPMTVQVAGLFDARFVMSGHLAKNLPIDMGPSALLRQGNVHLLVTSRSGPHFAPELFQSAGLDPFAASVLVAKSPCGFRAAYQQRAEKILLVETHGCAPSDFRHYDYRHIPRPLWPWDAIVSWTPQPVCPS
jgi:microcystin degradation protein MlrC